MINYDSCYNSIAVLENYPKLDKLYNHYEKLNRVIHNSWPGLFNTSKNKLRKMRRAKMAKRFVSAVQKEFNIREYDVLRLSGGGDNYGKLVVVWVAK